ncbi:MAG: metallophosphoesterase [Ruminococcaceae bacterium]|nr:metallophosphoesterase [Oscillospiraceae bacterium]
MNKKRILRTLLLIVVFTMLVCFVLMALNSSLVVRRYQIEDDRITAPVRIALLTDLHSCKYGENQQELIRALDELSPDLVLLGGDIYDDEVPHDNTERFLSGIAGCYLCYYVTGNHEYWAGAEEWAHIKSMLEAHNITILSDQSTMISVNGNDINLCGVNDPDVYMVTYDPEADPALHDRAKANKLETFFLQLDSVSQIADNGNYTILLSHRPEHMQAYSSHPFDLVLCGHAHGGQWRIPGLLNGLYAPNQGLFPSHAGGRYEENGTTMIVSRGLARESTKVPRIFNRPELVLIDLQ